MRHLIPAFTLSLSLACATEKARNSSIDERDAIEIARRAIQSRENWSDLAQYSASFEGEEWHVLILRVEHSPEGKEIFTHGGHRLVIIDGRGWITRYILGR